MNSVTLYLFTVTKDKTGIVEIIQKYVNDGLESQINDDKDYNYEWEKVFNEALDDDLFTHWNFGI